MHPLKKLLKDTHPSSIRNLISPPHAAKKIYITNMKVFNEKVAKILADGRQNFQLLADYDFAITRAKFLDGK